MGDVWVVRASETTFFGRFYSKLKFEEQTIEILPGFTVSVLTVFICRISKMISVNLLNHSRGRQLEQYRFSSSSQYLLLMRFAHNQCGRGDAVPPYPDEFEILPSANSIHLHHSKQFKLKLNRIAAIKCTAKAMKGEGKQSICIGSLTRSHQTYMATILFFARTITLTALPSCSSSRDILLRHFYDKLTGSCESITHPVNDKQRCENCDKISTCGAPPLLCRLRMGIECEWKNIASSAKEKWPLPIFKLLHFMRRGPAQGKRSQTQGNDCVTTSARKLPNALAIDKWNLCVATEQKHIEKRACCLAAPQLLLWIGRPRRKMQLPRSCRTCLRCKNHIFHAHAFGQSLLLFDSSKEVKVFAENQIHFHFAPAGRLQWVEKTYVATVRARSEATMTRKNWRSKQFQCSFIDWLRPERKCSCRVRASNVR